MTLDEVNKIIDAEFDHIIGQEDAKQRIRRAFQGAIMEQGFMPSILLVAPPGFGKTKFLRAIRKFTKDILDRQSIYFESGLSVGTPTSFFTEVLVEHVHDKDCNITVDEFHQTPERIKAFIRDLLEPTIERKPKLAKFQEFEVEFDPKRNSFILATNKIEQVDSALQSRVEIITLAPYSDEEMKEILFQGLREDNIIFNENTLMSIAECNRGSARDAVHWINEIRRQVAIKGPNAQGRKIINKEDCAEIIRMRRILPKGVTRHELRTLLILEKDGEQQLRELASKNQCSSAEQRKFEEYLIQKNLLTVDQKRHLTPEGREYLKELRAHKFIR